MLEAHQANNNKVEKLHCENARGGRPLMGETNDLRGCPTGLGDPAWGFETRAARETGEQPS